MGAVNFINLLFGHLVGDYVFQNRWMAMNKSGSTFKCVVHCLIYTATVCAFTWTFTWPWIALVFLSHFLVDRFSLADIWLKFIRGRNLIEFATKEPTHAEIMRGNNPASLVILRGGFTALVYAVTDNTFHLLIMWYGSRLL